jgi:arginyl-tRNA synthetase
LTEKGEPLENFRSKVKESSTLDLFDEESANEIWALAVLASRLPDTVRQAAEQTEPAMLAKYAFHLAKTFNLFYHHHKIISEENAEKRAVLVVIADMARRALTAALDTMGIEVPEKM